MIYLDSTATTQMSKKALDVYEKYAYDFFYNPSAEYASSVNVAKDIQNAREYVLKKLGAKIGSVIFTSGATESNNLAIRGSFREGNWEYVFSEGEHSSVYNTAKALKNEGKTVKFVPLDKFGEVDYDALKNLVNERTRLVSLIYVSNETGAINDIEKAIKIIKTKNKRTLIHIDGVQAFNKIPLSLANLDVDFFSFSSHKFHGPKGVGGLYVKNIEGLKSIVFGGGQEFNKRSGTENVAGIMSTVEAIKEIDIEKNLEKVRSLKEKFLKFYLDKNDVQLFETKRSSPYILSLSYKGVNGETLMRALEGEIIVGTGSACGSRTAGNRVLQAIGLDKDRVKSSIRVSFDPSLMLKDVEYASKMIYEVYTNIYNKVK